MAKFRPQAKRVGSYRSGVEKAVGESLIEMGLPHHYETVKLPYVRHHTYTPDFAIGEAYIEVKGWWPSSERAKLLCVIRSNPQLKILMAFEQPHLTLTRKSKTTYAMWCAKRGIAWCGIPIPSDFLRRWLEDPKRAFLMDQPGPAQVGAVVQQSLFT